MQSQFPQNMFLMKREKQTTEIGTFSFGISTYILHISCRGDDNYEEF